MFVEQLRWHDTIRHKLFLHRTQRILNLFSFLHSHSWRSYSICKKFCLSSGCQNGGGRIKMRSRNILAVLIVVSMVVVIIIRSRLLNRQLMEKGDGDVGWKGSGPWIEGTLLLKTSFTFKEKGMNKWGWEITKCPSFGGEWNKPIQVIQLLMDTFLQIFLFFFFLRLSLLHPFWGSFLFQALKMIFSAKFCFIHTLTHNDNEMAKLIHGSLYRNTGSCSWIPITKGEQNGKKNEFWWWKWNQEERVNKWRVKSYLIPESRATILGPSFKPIPTLFIHSFPIIATSRSPAIS